MMMIFYDDNIYIYVCMYVCDKYLFYVYQYLFYLFSLMSLIM